MPSVQDWKLSLLREVGAGLEGLPDPVLSAVMDKVTPYLDTYWEMYSSFAQVFPRLQYLYVKRHCLNILMGQVRELNNVTIGSVTLNQSSILQSLKLLYDAVSAELKELESKAHDARGPVIGMINNAMTMDLIGRLYRTDSPRYTYWNH